MAFVWSPAWRSDGIFSIGFKENKFSFDNNNNTRAVIAILKRYVLSIYKRYTISLKGSIKNLKVFEEKNVNIIEYECWK